MPLQNSSSSAFRRKKGISASKLILYTALFLTLFDNFSFFQNVLQVYPLSGQNIAFLLSLVVGITAVTLLFFNLITIRYTTKTTLIIFILISSLAAYFMDNYNVVLDHIMIQNTVETDWAETSDLLSVKMLLYFLLLGILPAVFVYRTRILPLSLKKASLYKIRDILFALVLLIATLLLFSKFYTSFFREHKSLRYYMNPSYYVYSLGKYINKSIHIQNKALQPVGLDAKVFETEEKDEQTELVVLVVGEAARGDHFSLNGYQKETNPLLKKENVISFSNMSSCGTSTGYSLPCMFSLFQRKEFNSTKGKQNENILDVLGHTGFIDILWRDNNSGSKGVAKRVEYENYSDPGLNTICSEEECRDEGMLIGLDEYISNHNGRDILIVLHQMGNHGPAYYKRYPEEFEQFKPVCKTNQLENCSKEEINNAYDNALLYTDSFLSKTINWLKQYDTSHETAMIYFSDHGESLGEKNIYLHGMPYAIAPDSQTHIGAIMWFGKTIRKEIDLDKMKRQKDKQYSQDNLFHTLLGIFEVKSKVYRQEMNLLQNK